MSAPVPHACSALLDKAKAVQPLLAALDSTNAAGHLPEGHSNLPSPCVSVCRMDADRVYCEGCLRTLDELRAWGPGDVHVKAQIWHAVLQRCAVA